MSYTLAQQMALLKKRFVVRPLRSNPIHSQMIRNFVGTTNGNGLAHYLKHNAWKEDLAGNTKVYLVIDKETKQIAFYFALCCGLMYQPFQDIELPADEETIVNQFIQALHLGKSSLVNELYKYVCKLYGRNHGGELFQIAQKRLYARKDRLLTQETGVSVLADVCYPSVELTHLCKNGNYILPDGITIPLGVYVFWEIVTPKIREIADLIGARYVYLFAADHCADAGEQAISEFEMKQYLKQPTAMTPKAETPTTLAVKDALSRSARKLLTYYHDELKFQECSGFSVVKPTYDFVCFSMMQPISQMDTNRKLTWNSHSED